MMPDRTGRGEIAALLGIAAPLAAAQLSQLAMSLIASFALGRLDSTAFAAGGLCAAIIQTVTVVSQGLLAGVQPLLAADRGARAAGIAHVRAGTAGLAGAYCWAVLLSVLAVLALSNLGPVLVFFNYEPAVEQSAMAFVTPAVWCLPAMLLLAPLRFHLAVEQRTWVIMLASGLGVPFYAALLFYLVFGPPALGIAGAGIALAITWWLIAALVALYVWRARLIPPGLARLKSAEIMQGARAVGGIGWPIALIYAAEMGLFTVLLLMLGGFGTVALAAHQVTHSLNSLAFMPALALSQAATVRVAFHMGGGRPAEARDTGYLALRMVALMMAGFGAIILLFTDQLTLLFIGDANPDAGAIMPLVGVLNLILVAFLVFDGFQTVASGALRGLKDTRMPLLIGIFSYWMVGFPVAVAAGFWLGIGPAGIWLGMLAGIGMVAILLIYRWHLQTRLLVPPSVVPQGAQSLV
jgi:MATE family multidrug resistance protein